MADIKAGQDYSQDAEGNIVLKRDDKYILVIPSVEKIYEAECLEETYRKYHSDKQIYLHRSLELNLPESTILNSGNYNLKKAILEKVHKAILFIVSSAFVIFVIFTLVHKIAKKEIEKVPRRIEKLTNVSPEKQDKRLKNFRAGLEKFSPYINEIKSAFGCKRE